MKSKKMELLAPAGNLVCLHAAVDAGADAVYLGTQAFNARRGADNLTLEDLSEACEYAHIRGVRIYLTVNIAILPNEIDEAMELVRQAYRLGVDGFIVQDIGLAARMRDTLPQAELHISTQMNVHSVDGIDAVAALGAKRVTLARELSLLEVAHLCEYAASKGVEVEVFGHGALCICYSGQCFMSSLIGGRSANRGMCAQACRLPYTLHNKAVRKTLDAPGEHLLSPKDLATIDLLPGLVAAGVSSLKIEGRMKSPEYVHRVVGIYRDVLDRVYAAKEDSSVAVRATQDENRKLAEAFSRGFTQAYLVDETGNDMMSYSRPNNRGVFVGRIVEVSEAFVAIETQTPLLSGDVIEFWTNKGHFAQTLGAMERDRKNRLLVPVSKRVSKGDRVFRVRDSKAVFVDDPLKPSIPVTGEVTMHIGSPLVVSFAAPSGIRGEATGDVVEAARTKAVTLDEVREHIDRMGGTDYVLAGPDALVINLDDGVGIGFSRLHKVRAAALEALRRAQIESAGGDRSLKRTPDYQRPTRAKIHGCTVVALATNPTCARAARKAGAEIIYIPALNYRRGEAVVAGQLSSTVEQAGYPNKCVMVLPTIAHDSLDATREQKFDFDASDYIKEGKPVLVESLGELSRAVEMGAQVELGAHVPVLNRFALDEAARRGAERVWLSPELSLNQINALAQDKPTGIGLTVYGSNELMVTEHCILMSQGPCNRDCTECARRRSPHYLKDRKGYEIPVITDCCGRSHLYNAVELDVTHCIPELIKAGVDAVMVDTTLMNSAETTEAVRRTVRARDLALKTGDALSKQEGKTTGHLFRGVS